MYNVETDQYDPYLDPAPTEAEMLANPEDYSSFDEYQDVLNGRLSAEDPTDMIDWDDEELDSLETHVDTYYDDASTILMEQEDGSLKEEDPFKELDELVVGEKREAEHNLRWALEEYISLGGTPDEIMSLVGEII